MSFQLSESFSSGSDEMITARVAPAVHSACRRTVQPLVRVVLLADEAHITGSNPCDAQ